MKKHQRYFKNYQLTQVINQKTKKKKKNERER